MSFETPQPQQYFNPRKRLPIGMKVPDTPESRAAVAKFNAEKAVRDAEQTEQEAKQAAKIAEKIKKGHAVILSPEQIAADRARWEEEIKNKKQQIENMN